jgi:hypothetical protein
MKALLLIFIFAVNVTFTGNARLVSSASLNANEAVFATPNGDRQVILKTDSQGSHRILRISFEGNEGKEGTLQIFNSTNTLVKTSTFELIKSPFYASVDITDLMPGEYTVQLTTQIATHTASFKIN